VIVTVPLRGGPGLAATVKWTVAGPWPLPLPASTEIQLTSLNAFQKQLAGVVSVTLPAPPLLPLDWLDEPSE
jgi:hypothetical protein